MRRLVFSVLLVFFSLPRALSQDTLRITLPIADSLLVTRNLTLLALHYEVDRAEAERIQARLFNNPTIATEWNLHNPAIGEWFDVGRRGQKIVAIEQVFRIAGQRNLQIRMAEEAHRMTTWEYEALVRTLRLELHVAFYRYHFLARAVAGTTVQLELLRSLIGVYDAQYRKGNISLQELARLNATYFSVNSQVREIRQELIALQQRLRFLLAEEHFVEPVLEEHLDRKRLGFAAEELVDRAWENRPELRMAESAERHNQLRYVLARRQAVPDLSAGFVYDQSGSFIDHYTGVTVGLQLPIFNRNQGNIRAARVGVAQARAQAESVKLQVRQEVLTAWSTVRMLEDQYFSTSAYYEEELHLLSERLVSHYSKNNISLLEFSDLFEAYNDYIIALNQLKADLFKSYEELNYAVGAIVVR